MPGQFAGRSGAPPQTPPPGSEVTHTHTHTLGLDEETTAGKNQECVVIPDRWHLVEDVHHGFGGKVLQVLSVLAQALKELHASQHNQWLLQKHNTEL